MRFYNRIIPRFYSEHFLLLLFPYELVSIFFSNKCVFLCVFFVVVVVGFFKPTVQRQILIDVWPIPRDVNV